MKADVVADRWEKLILSNWRAKGQAVLDERIRSGKGKVSLYNCIFKSLKLRANYFASFSRSMGISDQSARALIAFYDFNVVSRDCSVLPLLASPPAYKSMLLSNREPMVGVRIYNTALTAQQVSFPGY